LVEKKWRRGKGGEKGGEEKKTKKAASGPIYFTLCRETSGGDYVKKEESRNT